MRFPFDSSGALGVGEAAFFELIELMWALGKLPLLLASSSENFLYCLLPWLFTVLRVGVYHVSLFASWGTTWWTNPGASDQSSGALYSEIGACKHVRREWLATTESGSSRNIMLTCFYLWSDMSNNYPFRFQEITPKNKTTCWHM